MELYMGLSLLTVEGFKVSTRDSLVETPMTNGATPESLVTLVLIA